MKNLEALTREQVGSESQKLFDGLSARIGRVPNIYATLANSDVALKANLTFGDLLKSGTFNGKEVETIALSISVENECQYCLAAHSMVGKMMGFTEEEVSSIIEGNILDVKLKILSELTKEITATRGNPKQTSIDNFYSAGFTKSSLVELIGLIALNTFNNYLNHIAGTEIDFPLAKKAVSHS